MLFSQLFWVFKTSNFLPISYIWYKIIEINFKVRVDVHNTYNGDSKGDFMSDGWTVLSWSYVDESDFKLSFLHKNEAPVVQDSTTTVFTLIKTTSLPFNYEVKSVYPHLGPLESWPKTLLWDVPSSRPTVTLISAHCNYHLLFHCCLQMILGQILVNLAPFWNDSGANHDYSQDLVG